MRYKAAAEYLGFTEEHLRRMKQEGRIPYVKLTEAKSGPVFFDPDVLDEWVKTHSHAASA
jgi:excisionase family DNA binding protein